MANVRDYIQKTPIDIELDRAVGVSLPFSNTFLSITVSISGSSNIDFSSGEITRCS